MFDTKIPLYSVMILLSIIANVIIVSFTYKKNKFTKEEILGAIVYENIGVIFGAKFLSYLEHITKYNHFDILRTGFSSYGGVIGALLMLVIFGLQFKKKIKDMVLTFIIPIPIMYAIGKIGCFLAGCCYGIHYNGFGKVVYHYSKIAPNNVGLFPIQITETIVFTIIFIYVLNRCLKNKYDLKELGISLILCGSAKFILDYLRISHVNIIISLNQIISLVFILIGIIIIVFERNKVKNKKLLD